MGFFERLVEKKHYKWKKPRLFFFVVFIDPAPPPPSATADAASPTRPEAVFLNF
jgi:hypothetical protein